MVLAKQNWPASSITSRSRLPGETRVGLAKSHAVPPITHPAVPAMNAAYSCSLICCQRTSSRSDRFFAPRTGSRPASIAQSSRFSTTACDCATTPMRQPCSATSRAMTCAPVYVLPVPGGPCTATYDESKSGSEVGGGAFDRIPKRCRRNRLPGGECERELMKSIAVLGYSFEDDHLGRRGPIVGLEDSGAAGSTSIRVVGQARRRRRLVERDDAVVEW